MPADQALFAASRRVDRQSVERRGGSYCRGAIQPTLPTALEGPTEEVCCLWTDAWLCAAVGALTNPLQLHNCWDSCLCTVCLIVLA